MPRCEAASGSMESMPGLSCLTIKFTSSGEVIISAVIATHFQSLPFPERNPERFSVNRRETRAM